MASTPAQPTTESTVSGIIDRDKNVKALDDKYGADKTKGGQLIETSFVDSVVSSYSNLVYSPTVCMIYISVILVMIVELFEPTTGPFEQLYARVQKLATNNSTFVKLVGKILIFFVGTLVRYKYAFLTFILFMVPWYRKRSTKNLVTSILILVFAIVFDTPTIPLLMVSQAWYLYTEVRNPKYKFVIMIITIVIMAFSFMEVSDIQYHQDQRYKSKPDTLPEHNPPARNPTPTVKPPSPKP